MNPVFGAGPHNDPGFFASMRNGSVLGRLRMVVLVMTAAPVLILAIVPLIVQGGGDTPPWVYAPSVVLALVALLVGPRVPRPMGAGVDPDQTARTALAMFQQAVLMRSALAEAVIIAGLPMAIIGESALVYVAGFVLGYPLQLWLALPTRSTAERIRRRLEAEGAQSHLWAGLLATAAPPGGPGVR
ncbi:MAG TPA: hypothetical protein VIL71_10850 [Spirillospora sp.]